MRRSEIRENVFKLLFRAEFNDINEMPEQTRLYFENDIIIDKDEEDAFCEIKDADREYISQREQSILNKLEEIDKAISDKATGWTTDRMGKIELAIIRLAVYEIMFDDDTPKGVAINEAVELAKKYGQDESASFVNGVLAKFAN